MKTIDLPTAIRLAERYACEAEAYRAVARAGGDAALLAPAVAKRLTAQIDSETVSFVVRDAAGNPTIADGTGRLATADDVVSQFQRDPKFKSFFPKPLQASKGDLRVSGDRTTMTRSTFEGLTPVEKANLMRSGVQLVD